MTRHGDFQEGKDVGGLIHTLKDDCGNVWTVDYRKSSEEAVGQRV